MKTADIQMAEDRAARWMSRHDKFPTAAAAMTRDRIALAVEVTRLRREVRSAHDANEHLQEALRRSAPLWPEVRVRQEYDPVPLGAPGDPIPSTMTVRETLVTAVPLEWRSGSMRADVARRELERAVERVLDFIKTWRKL